MDMLVLAAAEICAVCRCRHSGLISLIGGWAGLPFSGAPRVRTGVSADTGRRLEAPQGPGSGRLAGSGGGGKKGAKKRNPSSENGIDWDRAATKRRKFGGARERALLIN
jgi:hypothetical protein